MKEDFRVSNSYSQGLQCRINRLWRVTEYVTQSMKDYRVYIFVGETAEWEGSRARPGSWRTPRSSPRSRRAEEPGTGEGEEGRGIDREEWSTWEDQQIKWECDQLVE